MDHNDPYEWAEIIPVAGGVAKKLKMPITMDAEAVWAWSPDGKAILYARNDNGVGNVWSMPLEGGRPRKVTVFDTGLISALNVSSDGRLAMSRGQWLVDVVHIRNVR